MRFLIVDDDQGFVTAAGIGLQLQWQDAEVLAAGDGAQAMRTFAEARPDVVLLDINLPRSNGFDVVRSIREASNVPVIMITARVDELSRVQGLELGADDYLVKPFSHSEFFARIEAVLRRSGGIPRVANVQPGMTIHVFPEAGSGLP